MIQISVDTRRAVVTNKETLTVGSAGIQVEFTLSEDWNALSKLAVFRVGDDGTKVDVVLGESLTCVVPPEVLKDEDEVLFIGVYGTNGQGTVIIPTVWASAGVVKPGTEPKTPASAEPTPEIWAQILGVAQDAEQTAGDAMSMVEAGLASLTELEEGVEDAEAVRAANELTRISNEESREAAETARATAETGRANSETSRAAAETGRVTAETARVTAENGRVSAESERVSAEEARVAAEENRELHYAEYVTTVQGYANAASTSATSAAGSATDAASSASSASTSAGQASSSASSASSSASSASSSASSASTSATTASNAATTATTKAREAASSATAAGNAKSAAETAQGKAEAAQEAAETAVTHYPKIENNYWMVWDSTSQNYVSTGIQAEGEDGYSPEVTIESITGGHRVTITDKDHPQGQSFDVMDGQGGGGGTSDYTDLTNKPSINNVTLTGNKTATDLGLATPSDIPTNAGDIEFDDQETYAAGSIGAEVSAQKNAISQLGDIAAFKTAILQLAQKVAYIDEHGQDYYDDLYDAFYPGKRLVSISAVFSQGGATVYNTDSLDSLIPMLIVTATYEDQTTATINDYALSGTLSVGTSVITVSYGGKTDTFNVTVVWGYKLQEDFVSSGSNAINTGLSFAPGNSYTVAIEFSLATVPSGTRAIWGDNSTGVSHYIELQSNPTQLWGAGIPWASVANFAGANDVVRAVHVITITSSAVWSGAVTLSNLTQGTAKEATNSYTNQSLSFSPVKIGATTAITGFDGTVSEFVLENRAWTSEEIAAFVGGEL